RMAESDARRLAADPAVDYVEPDRRVRASTTQLNPPSWGLDRLDQRLLPMDGTYVHTRQSGNVTVFVIDTGISISHQDFSGRARYGHDFVDGDTVADDCNGHGTHVAGTIGGDLHGVAKAVNLVALRVLDCQGSGTVSGVVAAVDWVSANRPARAVANLSLGLAGVSQPLEDAIRNSISRGTSYVVAAGNGSGADACGVSPARVAEAITVGASTSTDARAWFSNVGPCVDLFAPGEGITSTWHTSTTAVNTISGTSMAAPHVAGVIAWKLSRSMDNDIRTPQQLHDSLVWDATPGVVGDPGPGSPNLLLFNRPKSVAGYAVHNGRLEGR
ncbi:MAG: S8 family peptidase, partial [Saccharothrix sp.]|nr:S8 family peptidase [Saccharothrix sp.]